MSSGGRVPNNTTKLSLHERFSRLRSSAGGQKLAGKLQGARNLSAHLQKAASRNNRITQQMERRNASVSAALKLKKKSIKQRLGATVNTGTRFRGTATQTQRKLTINRGAVRGIQRGNQRGIRTQVQTVTQSRVARGRRGTKPIISQTIVRGGGQLRRGNTRGKIITPSKKSAVVVNTPNRSAQKSPRTRGDLRGARRGGRAQSTALVAAQGGNQIQRGRGRGRGQRRGNGQQNRRGGNDNQPKSSRGQSSGRGRGRGRGGATKVSKEDLDKQLDQYMSKTRSALDNDLESYMSKIGDVEMN
ncbi:hypothetical protein GHT06_011879 [Daphnia sinensis]|uniref:Chromatin target of PRMT1 protein C-terminal domain-containing protein n=1 Tax=Daphnia sinensis TaxID=1820382 RepID=A0AAD5PWN5_9CRUS|nr:hypothetical protein GHT06_011879 [Daphnia sinensis]